MFRYLISAMLVASFLTFPTSSARAGNREAAAAALIIGGMLGAAIVNNNRRKQQQAARPAQPQAQPQSQPARSRPRISAAQRQQNREVQEALNYFGYDAGSVDGIVGRNTRAATRRYEEDLGFTADGRLDVAERNFLLESMERAIATGQKPPYDDILAENGRDGLLKQYRDEMLGSPPPEIRQAKATQPEPQQAPRERAEAAATPALPEFNVAKRTRSASQLCSEVNILTMANGGLATSGSVSDAEFALNEQFCLARAHAEAESNGIIATIDDMSERQIEAQCENLAAFMAPVMPSLLDKSPADARRVIGAFVDKSGQTKGQLVTGGRVCLGVGYRVDRPDIALASAAVLIVSGLPAYGEIISHHNREGLGTLEPSPSKSGVWLEDTLAGLDNGDIRVLGQTSDRIAVLSEGLTGMSKQVASGLPVIGTAGN